MNQSKPKKVLFILPALTAGGAERVLITLMNMLDRSRFEPVFLTVSNEGDLRDLIDPAIPFYSLSSRRFLLSLPRLRKAIKSIKPNVIVSTMAHMNFGLLLLKPFFSNTKFIVREAITPSFFADEHPHIAPIIHQAYKWLYPRADIVLSPAQAIIDEFQSVLNMSLQTHELLRNPVDMSRIRKDENTEFEPPPAREKTVHFIAAGRLHPQKGFDRLIKILPDFSAQHNWQLTILGEGEERENLEKLIREKRLEDRVKLPGLSEHPWPEFAKADCFLLPSRFEGLPNVALESLACGTPVIATSEAGGVEEIAILAEKGTVKIVQDMDGFLKAMESVAPAPTPKFRNSLLPKDFLPETVMARFESLLLKA